MRVLFTLILLYNIHLGCVIYEALTFSRTDAVRAVTISAPKNYVIVSTTVRPDNDECKRQDSGYVLFRSADGSSHYSEIYLWRFAANKSGQAYASGRRKVKTEKSMPQRCDCKSVGSDSRCPPTCFRVTGVRIYRRKLLAHERDFRKHFATRATFRVGTMPRDIDATKSRSRVDRKRDNVAKDTMHENDADPEAWGNWNNWSACSVTCGRGQQVRWRHCLSKNCAEGLKKAQMKSCRFKDCENRTKGFLGWLGIKS